MVIGQPTAPQGPVTRDLIGIQYLRAIAALLVVLFHLELPLQRLGDDNHWPAALAGGVDIFFIISGFIMWVTTAGRPTSPRTFWRRRLVRVVPLYWIVTTVIVTALILTPGLLRTGQFDLWHVIASYLFIPAEHPVHHMMEPVLIPGWTLNYEMGFYLVFGAFMLAGLRIRFLGIVAVLGAAAAIGFAGLAPKTGIIAFYTASIILEFAMGMALGVILLDGRFLPKVPVGVGWLLAAAGLVGLVCQPPGILAVLPRVLAWGIPAYLVVLGTLIVEERGGLPKWQWLRALGDASYPLYLIHALLLSAMGQVWGQFGLQTLPGGYFLFCVAAIGASILMAFACHWTIEQPIGRSVRKREKRRRAVARQHRAMLTI